MYLKRITISGFKSFADKVVFEFAPGVTCIVGPNGCGKSNIVDAFRWVLGEQSARSLRGRHMSDMIFNGSTARRASSLAQVELVFDNRDHALPLDRDEVSVTRRLYRSGESEYLLNNEPARLKDIRELLMDTGVGVNAYSVIEQGRVDILLQSNPAERRVIFEEAAGVSKYKARRREAERKLERTQQNLLRVEDILLELEKRLRSVKLQAGKARSYREYEARLKELRSGYAPAEYHRIHETRERLREEARRHENEASAIRADIGQRESQEAQLLTRLDELNEAINAADGEFIRAKSELLAQEERIEAAVRRAEEQQSLLERLRSRRESDRRRLDEVRAELVSLREQETVLAGRQQAAEKRIEELADKDRELARSLTRAQALLEDEKAGIIDLLRKSAELHNEIIRLNTHRESLVGQKGRLSERDAQIASELSEALEQKTSLGTRVRELDRLIEAQTAKLEEKRGEAARLEDIDKRLTEELAHAKERRSALASRADVLRDLQERREGVAASVQRILDARDRGLHPELTRHVAGVTADLFDADLTHARVVEAVLGDAAQYLVITDSRAFLRAFGVMGELPGRLTAVALDRLPPVVNPRDFSEVRGFVAPALDLVRYDDRFETLARHLFGKTVVVETLEDALAAAADDVHGHRFVTRKGDVVEPDGRVVLASSKAGGGILSRRSELRDIESTLADLDARIESLKDRLNRTQAERAHLDGVLQELRTAIYEANTAKVEARAGLATVEETVRRLTQEQPVIAQEVALLEQQIQEVHARSEEGGKSLEAIERENKEREALIHRRQEEIDALVEQRKQVQAELTEARVEAGQLSEKRTAAREQIGVLTRAVDDLQSALTASRHDQEQCEARIAEAQREAETGRTHLEEFKKSLDALQERCGTLRRQREELRRESEQLGEAVKTLRQRLEQAEADHHQVQMQLAETNVREEELVRHTEDELGIDLKARYAEYEHEEQDWAAVEAEMEELRGKIARLGNVNLDAISELEELEERHGFLSTQRDDLTESRRQLERLIEKLDHEARERFQKTFEEIRQNFRALFRKLFGGGRADVVLEDPEQVLECGIEILAQPPGKELQSISLMSGGEKSMTAIALLMSIFRSRPAPCTFLDEVDAALDEANNDRFNRIVREFVHDTQFVIVTHSKWTMNMADRLYGVTMQEPGVSTLVSVELEGAEVA